MGVTSRGLRYPSGSDQLRNGAQAMQTLATDADTAIGSAVSAHASAADPHPTYETSSETAAKIAAHEASTVVHAVYARESSLSVASGIAALTAATKLQVAQAPSTAPAIARYSGGSWPTRASVSPDPSRTVYWVGPEGSPPPINSTYARDNNDVWFVLPSGGDYGAVFPGAPTAGKFYWGMANSGDTTDTWETYLGGVPMAADRMYITIGIANDGPAATASRLRTLIESAHDNERLPVISSKVPGANWLEVANGSQNTWLNAIANAAKEYSPKPVWFNLWHEPYSEIAPDCTWSAAIHATHTEQNWVNMHRALRDALDRNNVSNVAINPILNGFIYHAALGSARRNSWVSTMTYAAALPDGTLDMIGYDDYNQWDAFVSSSNWESAQVILGGAEDIFDKTGLPSMLGETGCHTDLSQPGRASTWTQDLYTRAHNLGTVKAILWWNTPTLKNYCVRYRPTAGGSGAPYVEDSPAYERREAWKSCRSQQWSYVYPW